MDHDEGFATPRWHIGQIMEHVLQLAQVPPCRMAPKISVAKDSLQCRFQQRTKGFSVIPQCDCPGAGAPASGEAAAALGEGGGYLRTSVGRSRSGIAAVGWALISMDDGVVGEIREGALSQPDPRSMDPHRLRLWHV